MKTITKLLRFAVDPLTGEPPTPSPGHRLRQDFGITMVKVKTKAEARRMVSHFISKEWFVAYWIRRKYGYVVAFSSSISLEKDLSDFKWTRVEESDEYG